MGGFSLIFHAQKHATQVHRCPLDIPMWYPSNLRFSVEEVNTFSPPKGINIWKKDGTSMTIRIERNSTSKLSPVCIVRVFDAFKNDVALVFYIKNSVVNDNSNFLYPAATKVDNSGENSISSLEKGKIDIWPHCCYVSESEEALASKRSIKSWTLGMSSSVCKRSQFIFKQESKIIIAWL